MAAKSGLNSNILARGLIGREQGKSGAVRFDALFLRHHARVHGLSVISVRIGWYPPPS